MGSYTVERSITVNAPAPRVHGLVDDFHNWTSWSPWEDLDPALQRTYTGPDAESAPHYAWSGNRKAGAAAWRSPGPRPRGSPSRWSSSSRSSRPRRPTFSFTPDGDETVVTWTMTGEQKGLMSVFGRFMSMDKMIGPDFEKGLARLKAVAEEADA